MSNPRAYSTQLDEALGLAARLHAFQLRKSTTVPYLAHLLAVCSLVLEDGGDEGEAIAALLHDAVEDQGGLAVLEEIRDRFGDRVAEIVLECSDTVVTPKPPWRERKEAYLRSLRTARLEVLRIGAADKLHNVLSTLQDHREIGDAVWDRFKVGATEFLWYHQEVEKILLVRLPDSRSTAGLTRALRELEQRAASA